MDQNTTSFVRDSIRLLIGARNEEYRDERLVVLFQLQIWVQFPDQLRTEESAVRLLGARLLGKMEEDYIAQNSRMEYGSAATLRALIKQPNYSELFDATVGANGGWSALRIDVPTKAFDAAFDSRCDANRTVAELIDYQFRRLDHGGQDAPMAKSSHAMVFRWKGGGLSGKTIRNRWTASKDSAAFIYVDKMLDVNFEAPEIRSGNFVNNLRKRARGTNQFAKYFGMCAYVDDVLYSRTRAGNPLSCFPNAEVLERVRPETQPLSDDELARLANYKSDYLQLKDN